MGDLTFTLVNAYFQYLDQTEVHIRKLENILNHLRQKRIIIIVDFIAKSVLWEARLTDKRGELVLQNNLVIMNKPGFSPTFRNRTGASSNIDVIFASLNMSGLISDWCLFDGESTSDHNVMFNLKRNVSQEVRNENVTDYNIRKIN